MKSDKDKSKTDAYSDKETPPSGGRARSRLEQFQKSRGIKSPDPEDNKIKDKVVDEENDYKDEIKKQDDVGS